VTKRAAEGPSAAYAEEHICVYRPLCTDHKVIKTQLLCFVFENEK
jgi:hypothetical protein